MAGASINLNPKAKAEGFSARFVCLTGKGLKGGLHPIRLQLIHNLKVKRYSTGEACTLEQWDAEAGRVKPRAKAAAQVNGVLSELEGRVKDIVDALVVHRSLSLDSFEKRYRKPKAAGDVLAFIADEVVDMESKGKAGNAATYRNTARVLRRFTKGRELPFTGLTASKLEAFDQHLRDAGCTGGGISVYMRTLRAVVGKATKAGLMHRDQYPFETKLSSGYAIADLSSESNPRPISDADMDKVKRFPFDEHPHLADTVRVFLFSYYSGGMNFADIARLNPSDMTKDGRIVYKRQKTKRKGRDAELSFNVSEPVAAILAAFDGHGGPYLFPFLGPEHVSEKQRKTRIDKCLKRVNRELKEVAEVLGLDANLTTYVARHTFATTLNWKDVSVEVISQRMGHKSIATTRAYLKRLPNKVLDTVDELL
jgi:integrase/recombinase XerD